VGYFHQPVEIAATPAGPFRTVDALVDTGAIYTLLPASILREIGVEPAFKMPFVYADGRRVEMDTGTIAVRVDGRLRYTPCIFGEESSGAILGVVTLEELGLGVDPVNRRLIEVPGLLMKCGPMTALSCAEICKSCRRPLRREFMNGRFGIQADSP
jgi:clan AA aspartic protease